MIVVLLGAIGPCEGWEQFAADEASNIMKEEKGEFGLPEDEWWECKPYPLNIEHGQTGEIKLVFVAWKPYYFEREKPKFAVDAIQGPLGDPSGSETIQVFQDPAPDKFGYSTLPGSIQVHSNAVDGPPRVENYVIKWSVDWRKSYYCIVNVVHTEPVAPTPTTPPSTPTPPKPPVITTEDGFAIKYTGPLQARTGGQLEATFQIVTPDGKPAKGTLVASLGDPPSDPKATHARGQLDGDRKVVLIFEVKWPAGLTKLYVSHGGKVYEITEITISP